MKFSKSYVAITTAISVSLGARAFSPATGSHKLRTIPSAGVSTSSLFSSEEYDEYGEPIEEAAAPQPPPPPPPATRNLDPLMASLTRSDAPTGDVPTRNIPLLGEVPMDGSMMLVVPTAVIGMLGIVVSIVVALNSGDAIAEAINQAGTDITQQASENVNKAYDPSICRGLCAPSDGEVDGLRSFMESLKN